MLSSSAKMLVGNAMALAFTFLVGMAAAHYVTFFYVWLGLLLLVTISLLAGAFVKFAFRVEFSRKNVEKTLAASGNNTAHAEYRGISGVIGYVLAGYIFATTAGFWFAGIALFNLIIAITVARTIIADTNVEDDFDLDD